MKKQDIKEFLEVTEAIVTIVVSVIAIGGAAHAWENGFWKKLKHVVDHQHEQIVKWENDNKM